MFFFPYTAEMDIFVFSLLPLEKANTPETLDECHV
jgi:hypothetical protein